MTRYTFLSVPDSAVDALYRDRRKKREKRDESTRKDQVMSRLGAGTRPRVRGKRRHTFE